MKNDEEVYMQLKNLQQVSEWVEIYYKRLLKLTNWLQVKATNVFFTTSFKVGLQPYLILTIVGMTKDTFIKHKEVAKFLKKTN
jgi:hypothetical protein